MAVAKVDTATGHANSNDANNFADFTATVTSGANLLTVGLNFRRDVTGLAVHWDSATTNQQMLRVGTGIFNGARCEIFTLLNPTVGASLNLHVNWTTNSDVVLTFASWSGTDTSTGISAGDTVTNTGTATTVTTGSVTSTTDGATFGIGGQVASNWTATTGGTQITLDNVTFVNGAGSYTTGGTSNTHSWTCASAAFSAMGVHILAASAGASVTYPQLERYGLRGEFRGEAH